MSRRLFAALALTVFASFALAKPNFTGQWKMDSSKSDFGQMPAPEKYERKITHEDPNLQINTVMGTQQGEINFDLKYTTDGKESVNTTRGGETKGTARWEGDVLVIEATRSTANGEFKSIERWTSTNDGKSTVIDAKIVGGFGEAAFKIHLDKQ